MASKNCVMSEDQFLCAICLEVFSDPVTTPCGHSFCKTCINKHWDQSFLCRCPVCTESFRVRPQLKTSTIISEMVTQFKKKPQNEILAVVPGDVLCTVCSEAKALKSCLVCLASYCQIHLENHLTIPRLKRHQLIAPVKILEDCLCAEHDKTLELFCRDDSKFICLQCTFSDHRNHYAVSLKEEGKVEQAKVNQMIKERNNKMFEIQKFVETNQKNSKREIKKGVEIFNDLMKYVQQSVNEFKQDIEEKQKEEEERATEHIQELRAEISELEQRRSEMDDLWCSKAHIHFLQTLISNKSALVPDWTKVTLRVPSYEGTAAKAVARLRDMLDQEVKEVLKDDLTRVQQFAKEVTLDPDTAHPNLVLSYDHKQVRSGGYNEYLPHKAKRFSTYTCVVGKQHFSAGRFYFEVRVEEKTSWYIGVAKESIERRRRVMLTPENGLWLISLNNAECVAHDEARFIVDLKTTPKKVGVFVDYEEGIVSFYDVDTAELIYSFIHCSFTEDLLPLFNPGTTYGPQNCAPLVLSSI